MTGTTQRHTMDGSLTLVTNPVTDSVRVVVADLTTRTGVTHPGLPAALALSPSRANDFLTCPLLFRLRGIDRLRERPTSAALRGTLVHLVLEKLFDEAPARRSLARATELIRPAWDELLTGDPLVRYALVDDEFDEQVVPEVANDVVTKWLAGARPLIKTYFGLEDPQRLSPTARELKLDIGIGEGLTLRGIVDRIDTAPGDLVRVVDYKTGRSPGVGFEQKAMFQMRFYALMWLRINNTVPKVLQLMYLGDGQILRYEPTLADLATFERKLRAIWQAITEVALTGQWQPRESKACAMCQHHSLCPAKGGIVPLLPASLGAPVVPA